MISAKLIATARSRTHPRNSCGKEGCCSSGGCGSGTFSVSKAACGSREDVETALSFVSSLIPKLSSLYHAQAARAIARGCENRALCKYLDAASASGVCLTPITDTHAQLFPQRIPQNRNRRNHRRLRAQNSFAQRCLEITSPARPGNLRIRPTALGPNRHRNRLTQTSHLHAAHGPRILPLGKKKLAASSRIHERLLRRQHRRQNRRLQLPRLLRRFTQYLFPAL